LKKLSHRVGYYAKLTGKRYNLEGKMATFNTNNLNNYGTLNQAEIINLNNAINNDPALNSELKALLIQLQTAIGSSKLSEKDKQQAITATQSLVEAAKKPPEQQKDLIGDTLDYFKQLSDKLDGLPETAIKLGGAVAKIALWFGV
jgi:hypothetical protein